MGSLRMSVLLAATAFVYGCSSDPALSLHMEDNGKSFSVAEDQDVDMTTFMVGAGQYGDPGISSAAVRFDGMEFPKAQVPGGPTQIFHFHTVASGEAVVTIPRTGEGIGGAPHIVTPFVVTLLVK